MPALRRTESETPKIDAHAAEWRAALTLAIRRRTEREVRQALAEGKQRVYAMRDPVAWFFRNVRMQDDGCWTWTGVLNPQGWPRICWRGKIYRVQRWVYGMLHGAFPSSRDVHTICGNRTCVCPDHLRLFPRSNK